MASWILSQQWLLSLLIAMLVLNEINTSRYLGGRLSYALWLIVPLALLLNSLPQSLIAGSAGEMTHYIISINEQTAQLGELISWQLVWLIGAVMVSGLCIVSTARSRFKSQLIPLESFQLPVALPKSLKVLESAEVAGPMLIGVVSPKLVLPANFSSSYSDAQQKLIIEHELCHYQRKDNLVNALFLIGLSCCWFNPIAWLGYRSFRKSQEIACDSYVLNNKSVDARLDYGKALINCAQRAQHRLCIDSNYTRATWKCGISASREARQMLGLK